MNNLEYILSFNLLKISKFRPDHFQQEILDRLHLEFFFSKGRFLITPQLGYIVTGSASPEEEDSLQTLLEKSHSRLEDLKEYLIYNLSLYSALLETNSYYIALNGHLLIARFIPLSENSDQFEIKIYTIGENDLPENYSDKIYLGRDFISLSTIHRNHFGLAHIRDSLQEQLRKLRKHIAEHVPDNDRALLEREYIQEVEELIGDFVLTSDRIIDSFPANMTAQTIDLDLLIEANLIFREIKHILIEIEESVREMESMMFKKHQSRAVRYVTKFRKDVENDINYFTFKVNGRISDYVNGIHSWAENVSGSGIQ